VWRPEKKGDQPSSNEAPPPEINGSGAFGSRPWNDVFFPTVNAQGISYGLNMLALTQQDEERLSLISDLNLGRVPAGKASALRTIGGMMQVAGQGDARPERILRRFFYFLAEIWLQAHELNRHFLDQNKSFRIAVPVEPGEDPYQELGPSDLDATFEFTFNANVLNTSKQALRESLQQLMSVYISEVGFMTGVSSPKTVYGLFRDYGKSLGQDPQKYIDPPGGQEQISFEEALALIMGGEMPKGMPAEGPMQHLQMLQEFVQNDRFGLLKADEVELYNQWMMYVEGVVQQFMQRQAMAQAAQQLQQGQQGSGQQQQPAAPANNSQPQVQPNELLDETLPTSGGGGAIA